jgi:hypothetical protein
MIMLRSYFIILHDSREKASLTPSRPLSDYNLK